MEPQNISEVLKQTEGITDAIFPEGKAELRRSRALLRAAQAVAGVVFLAALAFHALHGAGLDGQGDGGFYLSLLLIVGSLLFLVFGAQIATRMTERGRIAALVQSRLDHLQNRLSYREDLLKLVSDHQPGAIMIFDRQNRYWFVNERAADAIGRPMADIIGLPPAKVLPPEVAKRIDVRLAEARAAGHAVEYIDRVVVDEGETRFIQEHYEALGSFAAQEGCVLVSEDDLTSLIVERERRERMLRQVIDTLVAVVDRRDPYASGHSGRVGQLARAVAEEMELPTKEIDATEIAGSLMNFGKVLVSRHILTKVTPLTPEELQRVRDSILTSADILSIIGFEGPVVPTLRQVLEHYDGTGVPEGLQGAQILTTAQIVAVSNAFVALVSPRAHRDGMSVAEALQRLKDDGDRAYDHRVLVALTNYIENRPNKLEWIKTLK